MLTNAIIIFALAAVGGLFLAAKVLTGKLAPWLVSIAHALLGATGLIVLAGIVMGGQGPARITAALGLLVVAALGGFFLASFHIRGKLPPKSVVIIHAGVAITGFLTLISVAFGA